MLELSLSLPNRCRPCARTTGTKRALKPVQVWGIRIRLQVQQRLRDLALFDLALDSKLRGCDLVALKVSDVTSGTRVRSRAMILQRKTVGLSSSRSPNKPAARSQLGSRRTNYCGRLAVS
jgi:hypothetical protein